MDDSLGSELKKVRKHKKMTLQQTADQSGLSVSYLSQVERGLRTLTFTSLKRICEALEVDVNFFFNNKESSVSKNGRFTKSGDHFVYKSLTGTLDNPDFIPAVIELSSGESRQAPYSHSGQEFVYVLSGSLEVEIEGVKETLYQNESLHIDSNTAHHWYNVADEAARILLVTSKG